MRNLEIEIEKYLQSDPLRFHTPLHKGRDEEIAKITSRFDVTEVGAFDNLHHQEGVILQMTEKCNEVFGAKKSYISTQGTSLANLVMMRAIGKKGKVAVLRSCHKSIYHAIDLFKIDAEFIDDFEEWKECKSVDIEKIKIAMQNGAKSVVITCPSYYGKDCDLKKIKELCEEYGGILAVDEAHGTHRYFMEKSEKTMLATRFADIFSGSFHKTLPAITGSAFLSVNNESLICDCDESFEMLHSTSPNYQCLLSVEYCLDNVENFKNKYADWQKDRAWLSENIASADIKEEKTDDIGKLVLLFAHPQRVQAALEEAGIYPEFCDLSRVVFLLNFLDTKEDYERLFSVLKTIKIMQSFALEVAGENRLSLDAINTANISPIRVQDYFHECETEEILIRDANKRISACNFGIYPPCFFLVTRGEMITEEILKLSRCGVEFFGIKNGRVKVVKRSVEIDMQPRFEWIISNKI